MASENFESTIADFKLSSIRDDFPILNELVNNKPLVYLDNAATAQKPNSVIDAISDYYRHHNSNVHRGVHSLSQKATSIYEEAREQVRIFLNAGSSEEIIFTKGTTESVNLVASSFSEKFINEGDEIIVSEMEHHSNIVPWQLAAQKKGAKVVKLSFTDNGVLEIGKLPQLINSKTKLIAVAHVSNVLGTINPIAEICEIAHQNNVAVFVDGAQAAQHVSIDVQKTDVDFYAFSAHKMLCGLICLIESLSLAPLLLMFDGGVPQSICIWFLPIFSSGGRPISLMLY